jgi:hypothetical protein
MARAVALLLLVAALAGCGADSGPAKSPAPPESHLLTVPDAVRQDGAGAVRRIRAAGLTAVVEDVQGITRADPSGCTVTGEDPPAGSKARRAGDVTLTVDCRERDWEAQQGDAWQAFDEAYRSGFDSGCERLFGLSGTGFLQNGATEYAVADCKHLNPHDAGQANTIPTQLPQYPNAAGRRAGIGDGCKALFDQEAVDQLSADDGAALVSADDCSARGGDRTHTPQRGKGF